MKKKKTNIIKFISFLLLIFSFNLSVNAETTKIYYADDRGIRKFAAEAPTGYPNHEGGVEAPMYRSRTITGTYKPTLYYECAVSETEGAASVFQTTACDSEESKNPEYKYQKSKTYRCVESSSATVKESEVIEGYKDSDGEACNKYSEWSPATNEKPTGYDEKRTDLYQTYTARVYFWYKEVANGTTIDFTNNKVLYDAIKSEISTTQIKNAEINFIEEKDKDGKDTYKILAADISKITSLDLRMNNIVDITQLGKFTGLTKLDLSTNKIVNIDSLKYLVNLEKLFLSRNYIISIEPIIGLKKLEVLYLECNEIINLNLLKKIENYNSIEKHFYLNDFKKSGLIKNWAEFTDEIMNFSNEVSNESEIYAVKYTQDSLTFLENNKEIGKFEFKNNILKFVSGDIEAERLMLLFLRAIGYSYNDIAEKGSLCEENDIKCYYSKFGDYLKLDVKYDESSDRIEKMDFSFDLRYFFGDNVPGKNPKTGVSNALVLLGITLLSSAIGFMVLFRHKTGIQL